MGLLSVVGGKKVRPSAQFLLVCHVRLGKEDAELSGQLVEEQAVEEGVCSPSLWGRGAASLQGVPMTFGRRVALG
jgi:hypothetical protein